MGVASMRRLVVLAALLVTAAAAQAADCVTKTQLIATRGFNPNRVAGPVAWDGNRLGVASTETGSAKAIYFTLYDDELNPVSPDIKIADTSLDGPVTLIWNGLEYGLFYQTTTRGIRLQLISRDGDLLSGPATITPNHLNFSEDEFHVVWDPSRNAYVMARTVTQGGDKGLWLIQLGRDGRLRNEIEVELFPARPALPRVTVTESGMIGLFYIHGLTNVLSLLRLDPTETLQQAIPVASKAGRNILVHSRNNLFGVVRRIDIPDSRTEIRWIVLDENGSTVVGDRQLVAPRGVDVAPAGLGGNEDEWALSYVDSIGGFDVDRGELRLRRFTTAGGTISDTHFANDTLRANAIPTHGLVWTGASYVTAGRFFVDIIQGSDSYLISHCPLAATAFVDLPIVRRYHDVTFTTTVTGGIPPYRYQWDFGDRNFATGPTVKHAYQHTGEYTATVVVTDAAGARSIFSVGIRVVESKKRAVRH